MKITVTTGIFPPESGGPATYAENVSRRLASRGHDVTVVTMSPARQGKTDQERDFGLHRVNRRGKVSNYLRYVWVLIKQVRQADVVYSLDYFSYGFLTGLVARLYGKPYVVRVGGAYLWEHFYLYDNEPIPLTDFYRQDLYKQYPVKFRILRFVLSGASRVVFNSDRQADLYRKPYELNDGQVTVVHNPIPRHEFTAERTEPNQEIVYAGRLTPMKNVSALIRAFAKADLQENRLIIIGDGPTAGDLRELADELSISDRVEFIGSLPQEELFKRIVNARLAVLPSWTDISPNFVFECRSLGIPVLVTQENYLPFRDNLPQMINPGSVADIANKLSLLTRDDKAYDTFVDTFMDIDFAQSWEDVVRSHMDLFQQISD